MRPKSKAPVQIATGDPEMATFSSVFRGARVARACRDADLGSCHPCIRTVIGHATRIVAQAKPVLFTAEGDQMCGMTRVEVDPQDPLLETATLEFSPELFLDRPAQGRALHRQVRLERKLVLLDKLTKQSPPSDGACATVRRHPKWLPSQAARDAC